MQQITYRADFIKLATVAFDFGAFHARRGLPPLSLRAFLSRLATLSRKNGGKALDGCIDAISAAHAVYMASYSHVLESAVAGRCAV